MNLTHCWSGVNLLVTRFTTWLATMPANTEEEASLGESPSTRKLFRYLKKCPRMKRGHQVACRWMISTLLQTTSATETVVPRSTKSKCHTKLRCSKFKMTWWRWIKYVPCTGLFIRSDTWVGLTWILLFHCQPSSAWANGNLAEVAEQLGQMVEHYKSKSTQPTTLY